MKMGVWVCKEQRNGAVVLGAIPENTSWAWACLAQAHTLTNKVWFLQQSKSNDILASSLLARLLQTHNWEQNDFPTKMNVQSCPDSGRKRELNRTLLSRSLSLVDGFLRTPLSSHKYSENRVTVVEDGSAEQKWPLSVDLWQNGLFHDIVRHLFALWT